jgi:hypothetical protein
MSEPKDIILDFGKYRDLSLQEIIEKDPGYLIWLMKQKNSIDKPYYNILKERFNNPHDYMMTWGKYRGFLLSEINKIDNAYITYLYDSNYVKNNCPKLYKCIEKFDGV